MAVFSAVVESLYIREAGEDWDRGFSFLGGDKDAEWRLNFFVNGERIGGFRSDAMRDGAVVSESELLAAFTAAVGPEAGLIPAGGAVFELVAGGVEADDSVPERARYGSDDALPTAILRFGPLVPNDPGQELHNTVFTSVGANNDFEYVVAWRVSFVNPDPLA